LSNLSLALLPFDWFIVVQPHLPQSHPTENATPHPHCFFSPTGHKSFFAHDDAVTGVAFVANTHYFFTCSKDKCVKYWDGDRFIAINTLGGGVGLGATHKAEVWALAAAPDGSFVATAGGDRSLRIWRRGAEQVFPEEEREAELEGVWGRDAEGDGEAVLSREDAVGPVGLDGQGIPTEEGKVVTAPLAAPGGGSSSSAGGGGSSATAIVASASAESSRGGERLFEALAIAIKEQEAWERYVEECDMAEELGEDVGGVVPPQLNAALLGATPTAHVVKTLRSIAPGDLDQVLLLLPFSSAFILLRFLALALAKGQAIELGARAVLLLLRCHGAQLTASGRHGAFLRLLRDSVLRALGEARDTVGFNAAGLGALEACLAGEALVKLEFGKALSSSAESGEGGPSKGKFGDGLVNAGKRQKVRLL
jgi:U3 small nucleolar RNA-associated protein 12